MAALLLSMGSSTLFAQRKDSDAKISHSNYARVKERKKVADASVRVRYAFNALDLNDKSTWIDEGQLKIAKGMTDYSSRFVEVNEDSLSAWFDAHPNPQAYPPARWIQGFRPDYWIEYQYSQIVTRSGRMEEWATMPRALDTQNLYYVEPLPLMSWVIGAETKEICGYKCVKATCHWRGRDYTAWFTSEIPVPVGPWKFGGLPGLIMKVSDNDNVYSFEAIAVENGTFPIYAPRGNKYTETTRDKVWKLQRELNENYFKATGSTKIMYKTGQVVSSRPHKYSQLELE